MTLTSAVTAAGVAVRAGVRGVSHRWGVRGRRPGVVVSCAFAVYAVAVVHLTLSSASDLDAARCAARSAAPTQLHPLRFVEDLVRQWHRHDGVVGAWLGSTVVQQAGLNVLLFVPLGWFLRRLLRTGWWGTGCWSAVASMGIEMTQYTGVWGLAPCAYRVADVDDVVLNVLGALLGSGVAVLVAYGRRRRATAGADGAATAPRAGGMHRPVSAPTIPIAPARPVTGPPPSHTHVGAGAGGGRHRLAQTVGPPAQRAPVDGPGVVGPARPTRSVAAGHGGRRTSPAARAPGRGYGVDTWAGNPAKRMPAMVPAPRGRHARRDP
jgi:hypothetical protein